MLNGSIFTHQGLSFWNIKFLNERIIYELSPQEGAYHHILVRADFNPYVVPALAQYSQWSPLSSHPDMFIDRSALPARLISSRFALFPSRPSCRW